MTKKVRIWIVASVVWLIVLLINLINHYGLGDYARKDFLSVYLLWGILPVVISILA